MAKRSCLGYTSVEIAGLAETAAACNSMYQDRPVVGIGFFGVVPCLIHFLGLPAYLDLRSAAAVAFGKCCPPFHFAQVRLTFAVMRPPRSELATQDLQQCTYRTMHRNKQQAGMGPAPWALGRHDDRYARNIEV